MAQIHDPILTAVQTPTTPTMPDVSEVPYDQPIKSRRRQRIVQGLQRISSSPSMGKLGRPRTVEYRSRGLASLSCLSLESPLSSSTLCPQQSFPPHISANFPPVSTIPGSPGGTRGSLGPKPTSQGGERDVIGDERSGPDLSARTKLKAAKSVSRRAEFNFWANLPHEIRLHVLQFLSPKQLVRLSAVSQSWHQMCLDGQLWTEVNPQTHYRQITSDALIKIMLNAGPFVKNLNLRGCVQLRDQWLGLGTRISDRECRNLENFSIEGCKIERSSIHFFLLRNPRLLHIHMPSVQNINNATIKIIAAHCPLLELLNIDWCSEVDTKGLKRVVESCPHLSDLRASDVRGLDDQDFMLELFQRNRLERLILQHCDSLTDEGLAILTNGRDPEIDPLTERAIVPPRRLRHLDISKCRTLGDRGLKSMAYNVPYLEGLRLCHNTALTDDALLDLLANTPHLTHLEVEEVDQLTNAVLTTFAAGPGATSLEHLSISYCEHLGDVGVLPILKSCPNLKSLWLDNTRVSDLVLIEAAEQIRKRGSTTDPRARPQKSLDLIAFDCGNVTWAGVREIMSQNTRITQCKPMFPLRTINRTTTDIDHSRGPDRIGSEPAVGLPTITTAGGAPPAPNPVEFMYPHHLIRLKAFYGWQQTIDEHYKRCMAARWAAAIRLEGKWADWMVASEEAGAGAGVSAGGGHGRGGWVGRRRRRRLRDAESRVREDEQAGAATEAMGPGPGSGAGAGAGSGVGADEYGSGGLGLGPGFGFGFDDGDGLPGPPAGAGGGGRRRGRSEGGCLVM